MTGTVIVYGKPDFHAKMCNLFWTNEWGRKPLEENVKTHHLLFAKGKEGFGDVLLRVLMLRVDAESGFEIFNGSSVRAVVRHPEKSRQFFQSLN